MKNDIIADLITDPAEVIVPKSKPAEKVTVKPVVKKVIEKKVV